LAIHEYQIISSSLDSLQCGQTSSYDIDGVAELLQEQ
jgi:hypothetical protein